jgi:hypothetical protein
MRKISKECYWISSSNNHAFSRDEHNLQKHFLNGKIPSCGEIITLPTVHCYALVDILNDGCQEQEPTVFAGKATNRTPSSIGKTLKVLSWLSTKEFFNFLQAHLRIVRNRSRQKDADQWEIPFPALREAIANALIHRDYPKRDDGIYIELFDDRLEITNPGVFPVGTSAETFINTGTQGRYTNPFIADVFYLSGYVEQVGSGLRKMKKEMEQAGLQPPEFLENKDSRKIKVILSRPKLPITSSEPLPAFQVPYPPNPLFLGRNAELQQLSSALLGEGSKIAAVLPAIAGIGGIGKTQLASEFAHRYRNDFPGGVFWLNMAQPETVAAQVAAAGGPGGLDLPGWSELDFEAKVVAVRRAWNEPVRRLIVFDDLDDPRLLQQWRPTGGGARVLITTRRGAWTSTSSPSRLR